MAARRPPRAVRDAARRDPGRRAAGTDGHGGRSHARHGGRRDPGRRPGTGAAADVVLDMGWGRLVLGQTFPETRR